jgi:hypothetical protein
MYEYNVLKNVGPLVPPKKKFYRHNLIEKNLTFEWKRTDLRLIYIYDTQHGTKNV